MGITVKLKARLLPPGEVAAYEIVVCCPRSAAASGWSPQVGLSRATDGIGVELLKLLDASPECPLRFAGAGAFLALAQCSATVAAHPLVWKT